MHIFSDKTVKTRKPHECFACNRWFPKGTKMRRQVNNYDGDMSSVYWCETCEKLCSEFHDLFFEAHDGIYPVGCTGDSQYYYRISEDDNHKHTPEDLLEYLRKQKELNPNDT